MTQDAMNCERRQKARN